MTFSLLYRPSSSSLWWNSPLRWTCTFCFLHRRSPLNLISRSPSNGKEMANKKHLYDLRLPSKEKKITLSTTLCHWYKLQHGACYLSSLLGLWRRTMSVQRIAAIQPLSCCSQLFKMKLDTAVDSCMCSSKANPGTLGVEVWKAQCENLHCLI